MPFYYFFFHLAFLTGNVYHILNRGVAVILAHLCLVTPSISVAVDILLWQRGGACGCKGRCPAGSTAWGSLLRCSWWVRRTAKKILPVL